MLAMIVGGRLTRTVATLLASALVFAGSSGTAASTTPPEPEWVVMLNDLEGATTLRGVATAGDGSVYAVGTIFGGHKRPGDDDVIVARFDSGGRREWVTTIGGHRRDWGTAVAVDDDGAAYVVGFAGSDRIGDATTHGMNDVLVSKLRADGSVEWVQLIGGRFQDYAGSIALGVDRVYVGVIAEGARPTGNACKNGPRLRVWSLSQGGTVLGETAVPRAKATYVTEGVITSGSQGSLWAGGRLLGCALREPVRTTPFVAQIGIHGRVKRRFRPGPLLSIDSLISKGRSVYALGATETGQAGLRSWDATIQQLGVDGRLGWSTNLRIPGRGTIGNWIGGALTGFVVTAQTYSQTGNPDRDPNQGAVVRLDAAGRVRWRFTLDAQKGSVAWQAAAVPGALLVVGSAYGEIGGAAPVDGEAGILFKLPDPP